MTEAFCGKWIPDARSVKGAVEYMATVAASQSLLEGVKNTTMVEIFLDDNIYKIVTHISGQETRTVVMTLGEDTVTAEPGGITVLSNTRFENNNLISVISAAGVDLKVVRYIKDGVLVSEFTSRGKTMTFNLKRA